MNLKEYESKSDELWTRLKDIYLEMKMVGHKIGAFQPEFDPRGAALSNISKADWVLYRDARDIYKGLWKDYQELFEEFLSLKKGEKNE